MMMMMMTDRMIMINIEEITSLQEQTIQRWKLYGVDLKANGFLGIVEENHAFNFQLWHAEDKARRDDLGYEFVYLAKREIDRNNQKRNDRMEAMDLFLSECLSPNFSSECAVHSETPGMMIDRLSILALKSYHMNIEANRLTADESHRKMCQQKLNVILMQRKQLAECLRNLIQEILDKTKTFYTYRQFKMYNDKSLNPQLYQDEINS
jgi:hypothetical protein